MRTVIAVLVCILMLVEAKRKLVRDVKNQREMSRIMAHHKLTGLPIVIDYYSDSCGPCRMMAPIYKKLAQEYENRAVFLKVNTQFAHDLSAGVRSLPTFRFYLNGKMVNEFAGAGEGQLRQIVTQVARQARQRKTHIHVATDKKNLDTLLANSATLPVVVAYVSKTSKACQAIWPDVKKMALQSFGRAIFIKIDADTSKDLAEEQQVSETPTFHFYHVKQKQQDEVTGVEADKVKTILADLLKKKAASEAGGPQKCPDVAPQPRTPKPKRPQTRSPYRKKANRAEKVVILGAGPAGLSAAVYAARAGLKPVVVAPGFGGQLMFTKDVENFPAILSETGPKLLDAMRTQAESFDTQFEAVAAVSVDLSVRPFEIKINRTENNIVYALALIVSTGADARWLQVPGEQEYRAKGISTCATCDGFLFKDQKVIVVGGGDSAMEEALYLARICSHVTVVHRRDTFRASHYLKERVLANPQITVKWNSSVARFEGKDNVLTGAVITTTKEGGESEESTITAAGAFVAIGHDPNTGMFKDQLGMDSQGYLTLPNGRSTATTVPGVFACGDVADNVYRQAVTSAGTGAMAALDVERYMNEHDIQEPPAAKLDYSKWRVGELKDAMKELGISPRGCVEKRDYIDRLHTHQQRA